MRTQFLKLFSHTITFFMALIFSVQTLDQEQEDARKFCIKYELSSDDWHDPWYDNPSIEFAKRIYPEIKGKVHALNEYGVPNLDWTAARYFYNMLQKYHSEPTVNTEISELCLLYRKAPELSLLYDLFKKMPRDKRADAFTILNAMVKYNTGPTLAELKGLKEDLLDLSSDDNS